MTEEERGALDYLRSAIDAVRREQADTAKRLESRIDEINGVVLNIERIVGDLRVTALRQEASQAGAAFIAELTAHDTDPAPNGNGA